MLKILKRKFLNFHFISLLLLWLSFTYIDIFMPEAYKTADRLKFSGILFCLLWVLLHKNSAEKKDWQLLSLGLAITVFCDYQLLFTKGYTLPLLVFASAHCIYCQRLIPNRKKLFITLYCVGILAFFVLTSLKNFDAELLAGIFYTAFLLSDWLSTFFTRHPHRRLLIVGMTCFVACDFFVLLSNLNDPMIRRAAIPFMWFFYLPAQYLLTQTVIRL